MYKVFFYPPPPWGGGVYQVCWGRISSIEEEKGIPWLWGRISSCEEGKGIPWLWVEKIQRGNNVIYPIITREEYQMGKRGRGRKINILKNENGEEYQVLGNFIHPEYFGIFPEYTVG